MDRIWVVVANAARARVYERDPDTGTLTETADFVHPQSRQKNAALGSDRPGHVEHGEGGAGRGSTQFEPPTDPHDREREKFAREIAQHLDAAVYAGRCPGLMVFASNPFLGELKAQLGANTTKKLITAQPSDLTAWERRELERRVIAVLESQA